MDETLFYIVIFLIYLVFQALSAKKKKKKRPVPGAAPPLPEATSRSAPATGSEPTLDDALREIRMALGMEAPPQPAPKPPTITPPLPAPPQKTSRHPVRTHAPELAETAPKKSWPSEFKAYPTHYPDSDFEESTAGDRFGQPKTPKKPRRPETKSPSAKKRPVEPGKPAPTGMRRSQLARQLQDPRAARDAFLLSEILGPPRAHKRR